MMGGSHGWVFGVVLMTASVASWPATATADPGPDDPAAERLDPDYAAGKYAIDTRGWALAVKRLSAAALRDPRHRCPRRHLHRSPRRPGDREPVRARERMRREHRAPFALGQLRQGHAVPMALHADDDEPDAAPGVE